MIQFLFSVVKNLLKNTFLYRLYFYTNSLMVWNGRAYAAPSPSFIKQKCLLRNGLPHAVWVETGTYLGFTTNYLKSIGSRVYTIEPQKEFYERAKHRFRSDDNVQVLLGTSEDILPVLLKEISGDINFWLDGHYSGGETFKAETDTPIIQELIAISSNLDHLGRVVIMIDDVRCFNPTIPEFASYPPLDYLVDWAREHKFSWHIEHDIFVAKRV